MTDRGSTLTEMPIDLINTAGRHRKVMGDIDGLASSIAGPAGLIQPIVVNPDGDLVVGGRRLAACRSLGWRQVPVIVVDSMADAIALLTAERDENEHRLEMTVSEKISLAAALEDLERPKARARQREAGRHHGRGQHPDSSGSPEPKLSGGGRVRDIAGEAVGLKPSSYLRARTVVASASDPNLPPAVREVAEAARIDMDTGGGIAPAYERVVAAKRGDTPPEPPPAAPAPPPATPFAVRKTVTNATNRLAGICDALTATTELPAGITAVEAAAWADSLADSRRVIERFINTLRRHHNG